jgi:membrane protein DedA with SNARE-associated domain
MDPLAAYASLFAASFLAATVFPFQSELILMGLIASEEFPWWGLLVVATTGNTLGLGGQLAARPLLPALPRAALVSGEPPGL